MVRFYVMSEYEVLLKSLICALLMLVATVVQGKELSLQEALQLSKKQALFVVKYQNQKNASNCSSQPG